MTQTTSSSESSGSAASDNAPKIKQFIFIDDRFTGSECEVRVEFQKYMTGGVAVALVINGNSPPDRFDGEPWAMATYNQPGVTINADCAFIKGWSENEGLPRLLVKAGVLMPRGPNTEPDLYRLSPDALRLIAETKEEGLKPGTKHPKP